jgi:small-conductance mechanosensitive channel
MPGDNQFDSISVQPATVSENPKEYIRNLAEVGTDMAVKSRAELDRAKYLTKEAQMLTERGLSKQESSDNIANFVQDTRDIVGGLAEKGEMVVEADKGERASRFLGIEEEINGLFSEFESNLTELLKALNTKDKDVKELADDISKLAEYMKFLKETKNYIAKSKRAYEDLPVKAKEILDSVEERASYLPARGLQDIERASQVEGADPQRAAKLREIQENARRNIETLRREIRQEQENPKVSAAQNLKNVIGTRQVDEAIKIMKENPADQNKNSTNPSSYTTPVS